MRYFFVRVWMVVFWFSSVFWYNPTQSDQKLIEVLETRVEREYTENSSKVEVIYETLKTILDTYTISDRAEYVLTSLLTIIEEFIRLEVFEAGIISQSVEEDEHEPIYVSEECLVIDIVDVDTIDVECDGEENRIRIIGIDTPERGEKWYSEASWRVRELALGKSVELEYDMTQWYTDRYGRILAYVFIDWTDIWKILISEWYAKE